MTEKIKQILSYYNIENQGVKSNLYRLLNQGKLKGTGKLLILPVDQGFEHGPARSFAINPSSYDPKYHFNLAIQAGLSAYAAPIGFLEAACNDFVGQIPLILKLNNNNSLNSKSSAPDQAFSSSVKDALRLGCSAVGLTIYPGSARSLDMIEEAREMIAQAKSHGLATIVWSYPRGGDLSKDGESAIDITAYSAHIAALIGANIIKVKLPSKHIEGAEARIVYEQENIAISSLADRVKHIMQCCFNGTRLVVFSGGATKDQDDIMEEIRAIKDGGGNGSIIGRNSFQRPFDNALDLLSDICAVYES